MKLRDIARGGRSAVTERSLVQRTCFFALGPSL